MTISDLAKKVDSIPSGTFFRIKYAVEAPMIKEYRETHSEPVIKIVEATVRTGINYSHIASVKADTTPKRKVTNNFEALIPNKVYYNKNTHRYYLYVFPTENDNYKADYDHELNYSEIKHSSSRPVIKKIIVDNILEVC